MEQCTVVRASLTAMRFRFRSLLQIRKSFNLVKSRKKNRKISIGDKKCKNQKYVSIQRRKGTTSENTLGWLHFFNMFFSLAACSTNKETNIFVYRGLSVI